jgi:condensin complex subunit 2
MGPDDLLTFEEENDDTQEKQANKKRRETDHRRKSFHTGASNFISISDASTTRRTSSTTAKLDETELQDLFQNCLKLSTENKITTKNTWSLNLIDYLYQVIETTMSNGEEDQDFQRASCTIDASVKIYASRVDSVHNETYKVLTGLSRADVQRQDEGEEEVAETQEGDENGAKTTKVRKVKVGANTLETNIQNLNVKKFEFAHAIEPLYHNTSGGSGQHDVGSAQSLLLNNLSVGESCELILDAAKYNCVIAPGQAQHTIKPLEKKSPKKAKIVEEEGNEETDEMKDDVVEEGQVAVEPEAPVSDEVIINHDLLEKIEESQQESQKRLSLLSETLGSLGDQLGQIEQGGYDNDDVDDDEGGLFDADFGGAEVFPDFDENSNDANEVAFVPLPGDRQAARNGEAGLVMDASRARNSTSSIIELVTVDNEYSYFDVNKIQHNDWAGMDHWKFKATNKPKEAAAKKTRSKSGKAAFSIDFTKEVAEIDWSNDDFPDATMKLSKTANVMSERTIKLATSKKSSYVLPDDVHYDLNSLLRPFHVAPSMKTTRTSARTSSRKSITMDTQKQFFEEDEIKAIISEQDIPVDLPAEVGGYDDDDDDGYGGAEMFPDYMQAEDAPQEQIVEVNSQAMDQSQDTQNSTAVTIGNVKLIEAPKKVEKLHIQYATVSTKVDVKVLKEHMWSEIKTTIGESGKENVSEGKQEKIAFNNVISTVRKNSEVNKAKVPDQDFSEVSVPFCFICLLHLANEQNLEIKGQEDLADFFISTN